MLVQSQHPLSLTVLIDARNVLRSRWPNIPEDELVRLIGEWAARGRRRARDRLRRPRARGRDRHWRRERRRLDRAARRRARGHVLARHIRPGATRARGWGSRAGDRRRRVCVASPRGSLGSGSRSRPGNAESAETSRRCRGVQGMRPVENRDANGLRRGVEERGDRLRRRAARRQGGPRRQALRRPGGTRLRRGPRGRRNRPPARLRHERGQALQVGGARQAADPPEAERGRARSVQALAGCRARGRTAECPRPHGRNRRAGASRPPVQGDERPWPAGRLRPGAVRPRNRAPVLDPAPAHG